MGMTRHFWRNAWANRAGWWRLTFKARRLKPRKIGLLQLGLADRVQLIQDGHQHAAQYISQPLSAAVFNFGYLPRGDKSITTQAQTSVAAVQAALDALQAQGIVCAVLYHGHAAGKPEMQALLDYASSLPHNRFRVLRYEFINKQNCPPILLGIEKIV